MLPRALLLDLGGVLLEVDFARAQAAWQPYSRLPPAEFAAAFREDEAYRRHERGELSSPAYFAWLRAQLGLDCDDAVVAAGWDAVLGAEIAPTVALLPALSARLPCYLLTNSNPAHQALWSVRHAPMLAHFRRCLVSCELGCRKPEPALWARVLAETGVAAGDLLFLDDSAANVAAARAAGLQAACVRTPAEARAALAPLLDGPAS